MTSGRTAFVGNEALLVQGRTSSWNGASKSLNPKAFVPGNEYSFSANVNYFDGDETDKFYLKLQYTDSEGETQYSTIAEATAIKGEWVQIANKNYKIPADASDMQIYIETAETTNNFYIDEVIGTEYNEDGSVSKVIHGVKRILSLYGLYELKDYIQGFGNYDFVRTFGWVFMMEEETLLHDINHTPDQVAKFLTNTSRFKPAAAALYDR